MTALAQQQVVGLPTSSNLYQQQGWKLIAIPPNTKGPQHSGWNTPEGCLPPDTTLPAEWGIGLAHAYSGTCALDIDNYDRANTYLQAHGIDLLNLFNKPDAVGIDSGNPGHAKLIFKTPLGMAIPSKKITANGKAIFELRCGTADGRTVQDLLPPSRHPSGTTYRWAGRGNWQHLPELPDELLKLWQELLAKDSERSIPVGDVVEASWSEIESAVRAIDPDCSREHWIAIGMAIHSTNNPAGFDLWNDWSSKGVKYIAKEMPSQWRSFKERADGYTVATIFKLAYDAGWKRPPPDIGGLFKPVEKPVEEVIRDIQLTFPPPKADLSLWPPVLAKRANEVAEEVGCDPVVPLMAGLAAVSGAIDKKSRLKITETWKVPPILWLMTVGAPSDKKTPGAKPMFVPLHKIEHEQRPQFDVAMHFWKGIEARHASDMKAYRDWAASPESRMPGAVPPEVTPLPPEPTPLRLVINDATSQKVVRLSAGQERGFLLHLDEMNHFVRKINDPRGGEDRGCWIQGYESTPYTMDRVGAGTIHTNNIAIPVYGNCQPSVFREHMTAAASDGLLQRFIPLVLDSRLTRDWQDSLPEFLSHAPEYEHMIRQVFALQQSEFTCSVEALNKFKQFSHWYRDLHKAEASLHASPIYLTALAKCEGTCARLALLLHVMTAPYAKEVSGEVMERATAIMRTFFVPAIRYAFMEVVGLKDELSKWITEHIVQSASEKATISLSELKRSARRMIEDRHPMQAEQDIRLVMDELATVGYVTLFVDHPRNVVWTINPALATQFKEYRENVIRAKQRVIEGFRFHTKKKFGAESAAWNDNAIGFDTLAAKTGAGVT